MITWLVAVGIAAAAAPAEKYVAVYTGRQAVDLRPGPLRVLVEREEVGQDLLLRLGRAREECPGETWQVWQVPQGATVDSEQARFRG